MENEMTKMAILLLPVKQTKTSPDKVCLTTIKSAIVVFFCRFKTIFAENYHNAKRYSVFKNFKNHERLLQRNIFLVSALLYFGTVEFLLMV